MDVTQPTVVTIVGQIDALTDGYTIRYIITFFGKHLGILACLCLVCWEPWKCHYPYTIIPTYILPQNMSLSACALLEQFLVDV